MNDILLDPPSAPQPEKNDTVTFNKKNLAIAFLAAALVLLFVVILIPGSKDSSPSTTAAPVVTNPPVTAAPVVNKYDQYMEHVLNHSGKANTWSKDKLIEFGDLVCQSLDEGNSIRQVVNLLSSYSNSQSDLELFAAVTYAAITYICPEYQADLSAYLNN